jgi:catechol 2,3-dioxygenase-like lactoylglutathione lyase family enzyme
VETVINHLSIGSKDLAKARKFYDAAFKPLGYACLSKDDGSLGYGGDEARFWVLKSGRTVAQNPESGLHLCFDAPTRKSVDAFYKAALAAGGKDNGKPGLREQYGANYYAAFVIDPDGHHIEAYCGAAA